jgi:hypothetical protein
MYGKLPTAGPLAGLAMLLAAAPAHASVRCCGMLLLPRPPRTHFHEAQAQPHQPLDGLSILVKAGSKACSSSSSSSALGSMMCLFAEELAV